MQIAWPTGLGAVLALIVLVIVIIAALGAISATPLLVLALIGLLALAGWRWRSDGPGRGVEWRLS